MTRKLLAITAMFLAVGMLWASFTWDQTQNLSNSYGTSAEPDICNLGDTYFMVWNQWGDIKCKKSTNAGQNWGNEILLYSAIDYGGKYPVIAAQDDNVFIFYYRNTTGNYEIFMVRSTNGGQTFSSEVQVSSSIHGCIVPQVVVTDDALYLIYEDRDANWDYNIYMQKSTDDGTSWSTSQNISNTTQNARWCTIDASSDMLAVVWGQQTGTSYNQIDLFSTTSADGGTNWTTPLNITNNQAYNARLSTRLEGQHIYTAVSAKVDGLQSDIMLYHSADLGATWDSGVNVSNNTGNSSRPDLRVVAAGTNHRIYLTWTDATYYANDRTQVAVSYDGGTTWSPFESISQDEEDAGWAHMLLQPGDTSDNCFVIWKNYLPGTFDSEVWGRHAVNSLVDLAHITGTVTNSAGDPVENATVTADSYFAQTAADGTYSIDVLAGTYNVTATASNYQIATQYNINLTPNQTVIVDFVLTPQILGNYPPFNLQAAVSGLSDVLLQWELPLGNNGLELSYDDGIAEAFNWTGSATGQEFVANAFSYDENFYLRRIKVLYQSDASQNIMVSVLGDNGGVPDLSFPLMTPVAIPVENTQGISQWLQYDLDLPIAAGTVFYITIGWDAGTSFTIGADETQPDGFSYSTNDNGAQWFNLDDRDLMIRAGIDVQLPTRDLMGYNVYRDGMQINTSTIDVLTFVDTTTAMNETYTYHTTAVYTDGESGSSNTADIFIPAPILFPPLNLDAATTPAGVDLTWDAPASQGEWLYWDDGTNANSVGGASIVIFDVAARFDSSDLASYDGQYLTQMTFWLADAGCEIYARVWTGGSQFYAGNLIVDQPVTDLQANSLNEVTFAAPVAIDAQQELWIGYRVINTGEIFPAGCDDGPAIPYKGDMLLYGGNWVSTSQYFGWELNWNIRGFVVDPQRCDAAPLQPIALANPDIPQSGQTPALLPQATHTCYDRSFTHYNLYRNSAFLCEIPSQALSYTDPTPPTGIHQYYLTSAYGDFESTPSNSVTIEVTAAGTTPLPTTTALLGNFPNPFNPSTTIQLQIKKSAPVSVDVFNMRGQKVKTLVRENLDAGTHSYEWNGTNNESQTVASGIYFYTVHIGSFCQTRRMILMK